MESPPPPLEFSQDDDVCVIEGCREYAAEGCDGIRCEEHCREHCGPECMNPRF